MKMKKCTTDLRRVIREEQEVEKKSKSPSLSPKEIKITKKEEEKKESKEERLVMFNNYFKIFLIFMCYVGK